MLPFPIINQYGQIAPSTPSIKKIIAYSASVMVLLQDGRLYGRGQNAGQMFGDGSATNTYYTGDWKLINTNVKNVWSNQGCSLCVTYDNKFYSTGAIRYLTGGTASTTLSWTDRSSYFSSIVPDNIQNLEITAYNIYIHMVDSTLYSGGTNASGQHGYGNTTAITGIQLNTNFTSVKKIGVTSSNGTETLYSLQMDGTLYGCGNSSHGELLGTASVSTKKSLSTSVLDFTVGGYCFLCTKNDGVYVGGSQFNGQLGDGVSSSNIGNVGRTALYKLSTFTSAPDYIFSSNYMSVVYYAGSYYVTGACQKGAVGQSVSYNTFTKVQTEVPIIDLTLGWNIGSNNSYILSTSGFLYGTGTYSASTDLLPGYTTAQYSFVPLSLSGMN